MKNETQVYDIQENQRGNTSRPLSDQRNGRAYLEPISNG